MYKISFVLVLCFVALIGAADIKDCGSVYGRNVSVSITDCTPDMPVCFLKKGTKATITINFKVDQPIQSVKAVVEGSLSRAFPPLPFPIPGADACTNPSTGISCPLYPGQVTYQYSLPVQRLYPEIPVDIYWTLINENNQKIVCAMIPAKIVR